MVLKKGKDHWAFLDEIEAPMWVDLTLGEATYNSQDIDDEWFHSSHLFHQCSSRQLKAAFSCPGEGSCESNFELLGPSSPKLPSSVSKSRGKDYQSKKWGGENGDISLNKPHLVKVLREKSRADVGTVKQIKSKSSFVKPKSTSADSKSCEEIKPKLSFINSKGTSSSKRSSVSGVSSTQNGKVNSLKPIFSSRGLESSSSSAVDKENESNALSTVTSESSLRGQQNIIEVSSQAFGHSRMLLSAVRITLRKSCVTRQAARVETNNDKRQSMVGINNDRRESRMEINGDRRESRDRKSSSSKSSVGSSSVPSAVNRSTFTLTRKKEKTPDSRNVARMTVAPSNQLNISNESKVSIVQKNKGNFNSRRENMSTITKSTYKETAKLNIQSHTLGAKSSQPLRDKQNSVIGATKVIGKEGGLNRLVAAGKENAMRKMPNNQKCSGRENAAGGVSRDQNRKQHNLPQRAVTRVLAGQQGKICDRSKGKTSVCVNQIVHLR